MNEYIELAIEVCHKLNPNSVSPLNNQGDYLTMTPQEIDAFAAAIRRKTLEEAKQICIAEKVSDESARKIGRASCRERV